MCPLALAVARLTGVHISFHFPAGHGRFDCAGVEYVSVCPLVAAVFILPACIFIANPRRHARLAAWGVEYATVCPLVAAVLHLAGVHISSRIPAIMIVSPLGT